VGRHKRNSPRKVTHDDRRRNAQHPVPQPPDVPVPPRVGVAFRRQVVLGNRYVADNGAIGMWDCPTNHDNGQYCLVSDVCITQTPELMYHPGTTCEVVENADEGCVNPRLTPGTNLGCWNPINQCQTLVRSVLAACAATCETSFEGAEGGPNACH
jgi:hypothetical protein